MPTIDDFVRPQECVSEFVSDMGRAIRTWGEQRYLPIRQQIDEDWREHTLVKPLLKFANNAVERACSRAMDFMGPYGDAREYDIEKHWRDQKVIGLWMGGKALKALEFARYWYDLETL